MPFEPTWIGLLRRREQAASLTGVVRPWSSAYTRSLVLVVDDGRVQGWREIIGADPRASLLVGTSATQASGTNAAPATTGPGVQSRDCGASEPGRRPSREPLTVVVCTRERPDALEQCLARLADALQADRGHGDVDTEVLVVDNAPRSTATAAVVDRAGLPVRRVVAPVGGLSRARNVGLRHASSELVIFTDDDVLVDRDWLDGFRLGFGRGPRVSVVTGMVPSAEMETHAQALFDEQLRWSAKLTPDCYDLEDRDRQAQSFPYAAGQFGTGASMGVRRRRVLDLGGFDEHLGAGTRCHGGEDLEMFVRVLRAGDQLAYEPGSIAWHVHRRDEAAFRRQVFAYGTGLTAYLTKLAVCPGRVDLARRATAAAVGLGRARRHQTMRRSEVKAGRLELAGMLWGPPAYLLERRRSRRAFGSGRPGRRGLGRTPPRPADVTPS